MDTIKHLKWKSNKLTNQQEILSAIPTLQWGELLGGGTEVSQQIYFR